MSVSSDPFFRLPTELCCSILREWLHFDSVVNLDSAVCNAEKRSLLWNTIFASPQCVVRQSSSIDDTQKLFDWLVQRKLRTCGLYVSWDVNDSVRDYLRDYGDTIRSVDFGYCDVMNYMYLLHKYCRNVVCLGLEESNGVDLANLVGLFSSSLQVLDLSSVKLSDAADLEKLVTHCPNITHLAFPTYADFPDNCGEVVGRNLKQLKCLCVSNSDVTDAMLIAIAEHCSGTLEEFHMDYCVYLRGSGFNALLQKCSKLRTVHFSYEKDNFVDFDMSLLRNLTEIQIINQNDTEAYMTSIIVHCTKVERLVMDFRDSPPRVRYSRLFHLKELTTERLPALKVLTPFGKPQWEWDEFSRMRPDVYLECDCRILYRSFFDMTF